MPDLTFNSFSLMTVACSASQTPHNASTCDCLGAHIWPVSFTIPALHGTPRQVRRVRRCAGEACWNKGRTFWPTILFLTEARRGFVRRSTIGDRVSMFWPTIVFLTDGAPQPRNCCPTIVPLESHGCNCCAALLFVCLPRSCGSSSG